MSYLTRPVSFQPSDVKQPRDAEGHILLDDTDFTVTYAVSNSLRFLTHIDSELIN
jgi:hypothetical protein